MHDNSVIIVTGYWLDYHVSTRGMKRDFVLRQDVKSSSVATQPRTRSIPVALYSVHAGDHSSTCSAVVKNM
jgi:hypothetical protein